jgi:hypothetical protein
MGFNVGLFGFTNMPGATFTALTSTNVAWRWVIGRRWAS